MKCQYKQKQQVCCAFADISKAKLQKKNKQTFPHEYFRLSDEELIEQVFTDLNYESFRDRLYSATNIQAKYIFDELIQKIYAIYGLRVFILESNKTTFNFDGIYFDKSIATLRENGKKRLSNVDKDLIALSLIKVNSILASDDNRILTLIEKYYISQPFCCSAKILEKTNSITCTNDLKKKLIDKKILYFETRHKKNTLNLC